MDVERRDPSATARWRSAEFEAELRAFVAGAVPDVRRLTVDRLRPWSTVWRAETTDGVLWAKQNCPGQSHETALVVRLHALAPDLVLEPVAADPGRDLLLTADQGPTLRERGGADAATWSAVVAAAARLQRAGAGHDLGLTVLDPADAPTYLRRRVDELASLPTSDPRVLDGEVARRLLALGAQVTRWAEQVAGLGLPLVLDHNDLHDANVFVPAGGSPRFFDLGDAILTGPLEAWRIPVNEVADLLGVPDDDPAVLRVLEPALEVWSDLAPLPALRAALPAALALGRLARVESWLRCLTAMDDAELAEHGAAPAAWLGTLIDP